MAQSRWISQPIQNLCHTYLATVHLFDTEIAGGQGSIDSVFNRSRIEYLVDVGGIDDFNREALAVDAYYSIGSKREAIVLDRIIRERGAPRMIRVDNGPEFISSILGDWCYEKGTLLHFIQPGKPNQNSYIERFNRSYRQDVLDVHLFENLEQVRYYTDEFIEDYNLHRPHESLNSLSPINYKIQKTKCEFL